MRKHRKSAAISAIFTDKGFYAILTASVIMICLAAYLALSWTSNSEKNPDNEDISDLNTLRTDEVLDKDYVPNWPDETESSTVGTTENNVADKPTDNNEARKPEPAENIKEEAVTLEQPIDESFITSVNGFSGSRPVFSESLGDWRLHQGIDFMTETSVEVTAAADGIVEDVYDDGLMGMSVLLLHADGTRTLYQSLDINPEVIKGMAVTKGYVIGKTGQTASAEALLGYHLHYSVIKDGAYVDPYGIE